MSTFIKGDAIILSIWDDVSAYEPVACLTSNSLSETTNIIESQTKCSPGVIEKGVGSYAYEISADGQYIDTTSAGGVLTSVSHDKLRGYQGFVKEWKISTGLTDTVAYYGSGVISSLELSADAGDSFATFTCSIAGDGVIVTVAPNP